MRPAAASKGAPQARPTGHPSKDWRKVNAEVGLAPRFLPRARQQRPFKVGRRHAPRSRPVRLATRPSITHKRHNKHMSPLKFPTAAVPPPTTHLRPCARLSPVCGASDVIVELLARGRRRPRLEDALKTACQPPPDKGGRPRWMLAGAVIRAMAATVCVIKYPGTLRSRPPATPSKPGSTCRRSRAFEVSPRTRIGPATDTYVPCACSHGAEPP